MSKIIWKPTKSQGLALACPGRELFFGGARGGGKTDYIIIAPLLGLMDHATWKRAIVFSARPLDMYVRAVRLYLDIDHKAQTSGSEWKITLSGGYTVEFARAEHLTTATVGRKFGFIGIDPIDLVTEAQYKRLLGKLDGPDAVMRATCDSYERMPKWVRNRTSGVRWKALFVPAMLSDNPLASKLIAEGAP